MPWVSDQSTDGASVAPSPSGQWVADDAPPEDSVGRQVGLTAYNMAKGLSSFPGMIGDAANTGINYGIKGVNSLMGYHIPELQMPSAAIERGLEGIGLPTPQTTPERIAGALEQGLMSVPVMGAAAAESGIGALEPLTQNYASQVGAALGSSGGAEGAKQLDLPVPVQIGAGLVGGMLGGSVIPSENPAAVARLKDFDDAGINPSVGDVSQSKPFQLFQKGSTNIPGSGAIDNEMERVLQMKGAASDIASEYGSPSTPQAIGETAQQAVRDYRFGTNPPGSNSAIPPGMTASDVLTQPTRNSSIAAKAEVLYDRIPVKPNDAVAIPDTQAALADITSRYSTPALNQLFADPKMAAFKEALESGDNGTLPWSDLRQLRTNVRYLQSKSAIDPTIDDRALSQLTSALTSDMQEGALAYGGERGQQLAQRADSYYAGAMGRATDNLKSIFNANRPEGVYQQITAAMSPNAARSDIAKLSALQRASSPEEWGDISSTIISNMGKPNPGTATPGGPNFSVGKFMSDYNNVSPEAKDLLFSGPGQSGLRVNLDRLARVAGTMKTTDSMANSSHSADLATIGAIGGGMWTSPHATLAALASGVIGARAMYNPTFVRLMTNTLSATTPEAAMQTAAQVSRFATQNPSFAAEANTLLKTLSPVSAGQPPDDGSDQ